MIIAAHKAARDTCLLWYGRATFYGSERRAAFRDAAAAIEQHCDSFYRRDELRSRLDFRARDRLARCVFWANDAWAARKPEKGVEFLANACDALLAAEGIDRSAFAMALQATTQRRIP